MSFFSSDRERSLKVEKRLPSALKPFQGQNCATHRDLDFPLDLSDATLALLSRATLSLTDALLPLRFESRVRDRSERDLERDFFSTGDFERLPRDFDRLRDERRERDLK